MKFSYTTVLLAMFISISTVSTSVAQSRNISKLVSSATVPLEKRLELVLKEVKDVTGKDFDIAIAIKYGPQVGHFFAAYQIIGQKNIGNPETEDHQTRETLSINLSSYPSPPITTWSINWLKDGQLFTTYADGTITSRNLSNNPNNTTVIITPATVSVEEQFSRVIQNVLEATGKYFDTEIKESVHDTGIEGFYAKAFRISNQEAIKDNSTGYYESPEALTINLYRYPYPHISGYTWSISQWKGSYYVTLHSDGSITIEKSKR